MRTRSGSLMVVAGLAVLLVWAGRSSNAQLAPTRVDTAGKTAAQAYKNITILKDIPADQLIPSMQFMSASLGVECQFCHVGHAFEKDDKKEKQTAREMLTMMFAINKENFSGRREVTCNSCHHGSAQVAAVPVIAEEAHTFEQVLRKPGAASAPAGENPQSGAAKPEADQAIDKYLQAIGGVEALAKVNTLVEHGDINFGGLQVPVEVYAKAPDKRLSVMRMPNGDSITAFDGQGGWLANGGRAPRPMNEAENAGARIDAQLSFPQNLKLMFDEFRMGRPEKVGEQDEIVVVGRKKGQAPVKLYFDPQSGLLTRVLRYTETPLGRLPVQIDYSNYRDVGGVKLPEQWTLARPGGRFTIQIEQVERSPIPDSKFAQPPAAPASSGGKP